MRDQPKLCLALILVVTIPLSHFRAADKDEPAYQDIYMHCKYLHFWIQMLQSDNQDERQYAAMQGEGHCAGNSGTHAETVV